MFTDTGLRELHKGGANRIFSIGDSWTRKILSSVRVYSEHTDLAFFLYERSLANKFYNAHLIARERNLTADVLMRHSQVSTGYWEVVQDTGADVVRVMMLRCHDKARDEILRTRRITSSRLAVPWK